jgi:hypothetical protein
MSIFEGKVKVASLGASGGSSGLVIACFSRVARQFRGIGIAVACLLTFACARQDRQLQQHQEKFHSLAASAQFVAEAWLAGDTSRPYTTTALEQTLRLVEKERAATMATPDLLVDPRGADLPSDADSLEHLLVKMKQDVRVADADSMRQDLARLPFATSSEP